MKPIALLLIGMLATPALRAQVIKRVGEKVKQKTEQKTDEKVDQVIDKVFDGSIFKKKNKDKKNTDNNENQSANPSSNDNNNTNNNNPSSVKQDIKTYSKFDFVPGEKVIAMEDFSNTSVGDFPLAWNTNSSAEVVTMDGSDQKWFFITKDGFFQPELIKDMPENFTIEFDVFTRYRSSNILAYQFQIASTDNAKKDLANNYPKNAFKLEWLACNAETRFYVSEAGEIVNKNEGLNVNQFAHSENGNAVKFKFSIWRQKNRLRVYVNENKIVDLPQALDSKLKYNVFKLGSRYMNFSTADNKDEFMVSNIRYAVGVADTRSKLITVGKLVTRGILFDTNSDVINASSYGVLKDIAAVLGENPSVKIKIVGHTDSDGDDGANLTLSQKRASAVKAMLATEFKINESRMETDGKGEAEPSDSNSTAVGKANNRRVEFIKM